MSENEPILPFEKPIAVDIEEEMRRSYIDYAMSVIIGRALPDVRDGLKPVHRRVLYGMWESGNTSNRAYKKSARIVGDVMGKYHPHGDNAIYDTVVRMAQDFTMRYPLVDGQGNFGSLDGDNPAAMRYTEVRLTKLAEELIREDIDKDTVDWAPNYDGSLSEPLVLPARLPNLLVNGSAGIAVGMATNIPPHNLSEVIDAVVMLIDRPEATLEEVMTVLPGPDFPTSGFIHGRAGIRSAYETGRGTIQVRARATIEEQRGGDKQSIVVTEIPYQVNKARLLERMGELIREKRIDGITDLRDESDREGLRIVLDVRRGEVAEVLLNQLYHQTQMQQTFGIILLAIVDNRPRVMTLLEILRHFLDHRKTVIVRRTRFDLRKAEERAHVLEGLLKALDHLDEVIATIRASQTPDEARANLVARFAFSEVQARAILDMRLQRLTGLEREKILDEYRETMALIERLRAILASDALVLAEIRRELLEIREVYGDERRTEIIAATHEISIEDMIADEPMVITVSRSGYVKRSPLSLYRAQRRGGKGRTGMVTRDEDIVEHLYVASAHAYILVFTQSGRVYWLKVHAIPEAGPAAKGKAIVNLLDLDQDERFATTVSVREFPADRYLVFATERGTVKKTSLSAFARPLARGIIAVNISEGDRLLAVKVAEPGQDILLATAQGFSVRFPEGGGTPSAPSEDETTLEGEGMDAGDVGPADVETAGPEPSDEPEIEAAAESDEGDSPGEVTLVGIRPMGRAATGVRGIRLRAGDRVVGMEILAPEGDILTVAANGYGKRTALEEYRRQSRGGKGIINLKVSGKTGEVVGIKQVQTGTGAILITQDGMIIRIGIDDLRVIGRATQGVKLMDLAENDRVVAVAKIDEDMAASEELVEEGDEGTTAASEDTPPPEEPVN